MISGAWRLPTPGRKATTSTARQTSVDLLVSAVLHHTGRGRYSLLSVYRYVLLLSDKYLTTKLQSFVSAVHEHFGDVVLTRN